MDSSNQEDEIKFEFYHKIGHIAQPNTMWL